MVGRILAPMIFAPTLGDTPVNMLYYKRDLVDGIKVANQETSRQGDYPGLMGQCNYMDP